MLPSRKLLLNFFSLLEKSFEQIAFKQDLDLIKDSWTTSADITNCLQTAQQKID